MGTGDVELFPSDAKLTVDTIAELQAENEKLKDKLEKIEQIVNKSYTEDEFYFVVKDIKEVLEKE